MKKDKLHDIPKAFPVDIKVKKQTQDERKQSTKELLDIMLEFGDISKEEYDILFNEEMNKIEEEYKNSTKI